MFLDQTNPRFDPVEDESEAIAALCSTEQLIAIAESIAAEGLNPLELTAVTEIRSKDGASTGNYVVREGNRRVAALKLLKDPAKAPSKYQSSFSKLSSARVPDQLTAMLFNSKDEVDPWLRLLHQRDNNPAGRKSWTPVQQARMFGSARNQKALNLTDIALKEAWITKDERARTLSTVQRWISNPKVRDFLGVSFARSSDEVSFSRPRLEADQRLKHFFSQVVGNIINTRANRKDMLDWIEKQSKPATTGGSGANKTPGGSAASGGSGGATGGSSGAGTNKGGSGSNRPTPPRFENLPFSKSIEDGLQHLGNQKLMVLYHELCETSLDSVQLLCVGWWTFLTTLCSVVQNKPSNDFGSFLGHDRLTKMGFSLKDDRKNLIGAIEAIAENGNTTKHATTATMLNSQQLYNDVQTVERVVVRLLEVLNGGYTPTGKWP